MRKLLSPLAALFVAFVSSSGCADSPVAPDETPSEVGPDYLKPIPALVVDYDIQGMRLSYSKKTGVLTTTISYKNMGPIGCSNSFSDPLIVVQRKPASFPFWLLGSYVGVICDQPGGSGEVFVLEQPIAPGTWDVRAILYDESSDADVVVERITIR